MKFMCDGLVLSDAAATVSKACAAKTVTPVLECIRLNAANDVVTLLAYDGEISIERKIKADVIEEGEICVNGRFFTDFLGKVAGLELVVATNEKGVEIRYGDSASLMQALPAGDFPSIRSEESENYVEVKEGDFKTLVARTAFCCATDESRPILKGCLMETDSGRLYATALDGYRMAASQCPVSEGTDKLKIVCPARTLTEIARMLEGGEEPLKIRVSKNMLFVSVGDTVLTSRLYAGEFVRRENIFPPSFSTRTTLSRTELIESVERASVLIRGDKNNLLVFEVKAENILITANSEIGNVAESVPAALEGKEIKIAMNAKYILEALRVLTEDKVILSFNTPVSPFTAENETDKESSYLILPVRTTA